VSAPTVLAYGDRALLVELGDTATVLAWTDALTRSPLPGVVDLVPAAETLLVVLGPDADAAVVRGRLAGLPPAGPGDAGARTGGEAPGDTVEIRVRYDGPDLADVAALTGLSEADVVAAHTGSTWRVAFGGFAPGFGYLVGGDPRLEVPRRESPRTVVPAGAVGLAGAFSGVYPRESPGGWQLVGTTSAVLWDLDRDPPALLRPGGVVRFVEEA
jgi:KipI family sensor histidine kinase inhibitor